MDVQYYLADQADSVKIEILDEAGNLINTFKGSEPEYKPDPKCPWWRRGGSSTPTTAAGMNSFSWDLRYQGATSFEGMIIWSGRPTRGPKAPLGKYQVKLTVGDYSATKSFSLQMNPNLKGITEADLKEQFDLAMKIKDKTSMANNAVIQIRKVRKQIETRLEKTDIAKIKESATPLLEKMAAIELDLYQVQNQSGQDPLNFPIKLNNRLASLRRSVESGDAKPTNGAYQVFKELSDELDGHLAKLKIVMDKDLNDLNQLLKANKFEIID